ncbi:hypothetical protein [Halovulum sp. GXIMD14793]
MEEKERDAIIRMMIYIKYELIRNNMDEEADIISKAIDKAESRFTKKF